jgi:hypothetical protein
MDPISANIYGAGRTGRSVMTGIQRRPVQTEEHIEEKPEKKVSLSQVRLL